MQVRIYYEDTDCGGIVYHTNYIKYCERARSELFFSNGVMPNTDRIGLVVRHIECDFLDSAKLGDLLVVSSKILKLGKSSIILKQSINLDTKVIFEATIKLACIDVINKKIEKIPSEILKILEAMQNG
ncbi:YbgC/FadM family acyl-CoA thioesterase [Helicobacter sp. MIT 99-5507]|uniref:YbgC/FadM family acyl-CoA thioesterase n=1 Tax=Helicobacter sp. MIT 99-5507 TaxID=152489 RepID=UPI000E1F8F17|nr:YbgC/FadM family acyl-CoA thioesterase [Helicobacter sp. MIT 99-5507]RDU58334.1 4-hydroxybenzoyl-CoA thioesterase [Helicobacter sp. MIT 99-5507]